MYTVVIADDEYEIRLSLTQSIEWEELGFQLVGEASNGMEALELVETLEPDLLLTDIKMPFVSGIDLARQARDIRPAMHIAFLSGYDDFSYAQEAIQYNIINYMLKPLSGKELKRELLVIRDKMDQKVAQMKFVETQMRQEGWAEIAKFSFLITICMDEERDIFDEAEKEKEFETMAIDAGLGSLQGDSKNFLLFVTRFLDAGKNSTRLENQKFVNTIAEKYLHSVSACISGKIITIVSGTLRDLNRYEEILTKDVIQSSKRILDKECIIGVSRKFTQILGARAAYRDAVTAWEYAVGEADNICFILDLDKNEAECCSAEYIRDINMELERRLRTGQALESFLENVISKEERKNNGFLMFQIVTTIYSVVSNIADETEKEELMKEFLISDKISVNYSYDDIMKLAVKASSIIVKQRRQNSEIICEELLNIIEKNYMNEELSLSGISQHLNVSAGYLSTIVKKTQGKNFVNLLTSKRMEAAKEYLFYSSKKIMEIAKECGYSDYHYFSYCFKKFYGVSPNKMREQNK